MTGVEWKRVLRNDPCVYCLRTSEAIDHIHSTRRGGVNAWENWAPACRICNSSKSATGLLMFLCRQERTPVKIETLDRPTGAIYLIRNVADDLWVRVKRRAATEGHPLRFILIKLLEHYARHGLS